MLNREHITADEIISCLEKRWVPEAKDEFPYSVVQHTRRYLGSHYLTTYPWLAISRVQGFEGGWCLWCALFYTTKQAGGSGNSAGQGLGSLVQKPLTRFNKLSGKDGELSHHNSTNYHRWSTEKVFKFQNQSKPGAQGDVRNMQNAARLQTINKNRLVLTSVIETILLCARQNIPFRGHRDSGRITSDEDTVTNEGNFRALLRYQVRGGDDVLRMHLFEPQGPD